MGDFSSSSPSSPGIRRRSLPSVQRRPVSASLEHRPGTVPAGACRGGGIRSTSQREDTPLTEARPGELGALEQEEWVKASWKTGERRVEIKLIAEASGLTFDDARVVALRLYNHFNWLSQLQERSEQLLAVVRHERRLSLSLVRKDALAQAARGLLGDGTAGSAGGVKTWGARHEATDDEAEDDDSCAPAEEDVLDTRNKFNRYVRGLCVVCHEGSVDQMLGVLFRAYSVARDDGTITRNEMASILAKHVVYEDAEDPAAEKERVYRWLKRQFIQLTTAASSTTAPESVVDSEKHLGVPAAAATGRYHDGGFISWDSARELLRRGPQYLENSLAIDLPCLSKDLWSADLVDVGRTRLSSPSLQ